MECCCKIFGDFVGFGVLVLKCSGMLCFVLDIGVELPNDGVDVDACSLL